MFLQDLQACFLIIDLIIMNYLTEWFFQVMESLINTFSFWSGNTSSTLSGFFSSKEHSSDQLVLECWPQVGEGKERNVWIQLFWHMIWGLADLDWYLQLYGLFFPISSKRCSICTTTRQEGKYHNLCYTRCAALAGMRNSSIGPPWRIDLMVHYTMSGPCTTEPGWAPYVIIRCSRTLGYRLSY